MRREALTVEAVSDQLTENEIAVIEAAVEVAEAKERLAVLLAASEWGKATLLECQTAKRHYARAKIAFRLALVKLRCQGES